MSYFYIQNIDTGLVLDIKDSQQSSHGDIIMFSSHGRSNQLWTYQNGMIYSKLNGLVLDINQTNQQVTTYPAHGGPNQRWHFDNDGIVRSDTGKVLDVRDGNRNQRAQVIAYTRSGTKNQKFRRIYV